MVVIIYKNITWGGKGGGWRRCFNTVVFVSFVTTDSGRRNAPRSFLQLLKSYKIYMYGSEEKQWKCVASVSNLELMQEFFY